MFTIWVGQTEYDLILLKSATHNNRKIYLSKVVKHNGSTLDKAISTMPKGKITIK